MPKKLRTDQLHPSPDEILPKSLKYQDYRCESPSSSQHINLLFANSMFFSYLAVSVLQILACLDVLPTILLVKEAYQHLDDSLALIFMTSPVSSLTGHIATVNQNW